MTMSLLPRDATRIAHAAAAADAAGWLSHRQQALLHQRGWLRMLAPRAVGGLEVDLPAAVRLEEAVAAQDGSMAWVLTLCAGAGWFAGFMAPPVARAIIGSRRVCIAGSGAVGGFADIAGSGAPDDSATGYRISGRWDYASGAPMATHLTLNARVRRRGELVLDDAGAPLIRAFIVPRRLVTMQPSWRSIGLRASASHSYAIEAGEIDGGHGFRIDAAAATAPGPLYRFPFMALAFVTLAANLAGMAAHFLALAHAAIGGRRHSPTGVPLLEVAGVAARLAQAGARLAAARSEFYGLLDAAWLTVAAGAHLPAPAHAALQASSKALVEAARMAVDGIYPYCGLVAAGCDTEINRVWRDFHTATQHSLLLPE
ncbi:acyl-CoA dehydrogenase [Massilia sp. PWRC2]|uniref:acyl-CoA dehydrogenase n=1 Tax=Massilia sp. PWRC2 TaxID=2804626 RepID=UPI003CE96B2A